MSASILLIGGQGPGAAEASHRLAPDAALLVTLHGNAFAFDMRNSFYAISTMGAAMLERALRQSQASTVADLAAEYDAAPATIEADLQRFLADLEARGIILKRTATAQNARPSAGANLVARLARSALKRLPSHTARAAIALTLARLSFASFGWIATVAAWKAHIPTADAATEDQATLRTIDSSVKAMSAKLPLGANCKERALSCWALARVAGVPAALIVGVVQYPLAGHTWCQTPGGAILGDDAEHCEPFLPVFRYE